MTIVVYYSVKNREVSIKLIFNDSHRRVAKKEKKGLTGREISCKRGVTGVDLENRGGKKDEE